MPRKNQSNENFKEIQKLEQRFEDFESESHRRSDHIKTSIDKMSDEVRSLRGVVDRQQTLIENQQKMIEKQQVLIEELNKQGTEFRVQIAPLADLKKAQWFMISTVIAGVILGVIGFFFNK